MKYETPELTALNAAVDAIQAQSSALAKNCLCLCDGVPHVPGQAFNELMVAYADWE